MEEKGKNYFIKIKGELIPVEENVYQEFYRMKRREQYLVQRDIMHGLLYYDAWDTSDSTGCYDCLVDAEFSTEETAIKRIESNELWKFIKQLDDKYNICFLTSLGLSEREIAQLFCISQVAVHKQKVKLFKEIKSFLINIRK